MWNPYYSKEGLINLCLNLVESTTVYDEYFMEFSAELFELCNYRSNVILELSTISLSVEDSKWNKYWNLICPTPISEFVEVYNLELPDSYSILRSGEIWNGPFYIFYMIGNRIYFYANDRFMSSIPRVVNFLMREGFWKNYDTSRYDIKLYDWKQEWIPINMDIRIGVVTAKLQTNIDRFIFDLRSNNLVVNYNGSYYEFVHSECPYVRAILYEDGTFSGCIPYLISVMDLESSNNVANKILLEMYVLCLL